MSLDKRYWGENLWKTLYSIAYTFSPESPQAAKSATDFYTSLQDLLPCPECKTHYKQWLSQNPIAVKDSKELIQWLYNLEKNVNPKANFDQRMKELTDNDPTKEPIVQQQPRQRPVSRSGHNSLKVRKTTTTLQPQPPPPPQQRPQVQTQAKQPPQPQAKSQPQVKPKCRTCGGGRRVIKN